MAKIFGTNTNDFIKIGTSALYKNIDIKQIIETKLELEKLNNPLFEHQINTATKIIDDFEKDNIRQKEGSNFIATLMNSKNNTAWFTGGDLIVVDKSGAVIANVQLKTSANEGRWVGNVTTTALNNHIRELLLLI